MTSRRSPEAILVANLRQLEKEDPKLVVTALVLNRFFGSEKNYTCVDSPEPAESLPQFVLEESSP